MRNSAVRAIKIIAKTVMVASVLLAVFRVYSDIEILLTVLGSANFLIFGIGVLIHILFYFGLFLFMLNTLRAMKDGVFFVRSNVWVLLMIACADLCFNFAFYGVDSVNESHKMWMFTHSLVTDVPQFVLSIFIVLLYKLAVNVSDEQRLII